VLPQNTLRVMTLRRRRVTDVRRQRLAAARRTQDLAGLPARASIGAIEIELRSLASPVREPSRIYGTT